MNPYVSLLMLFIFAGVVGGALLVLAHIFAPTGNKAKAMPYECGIEPRGSTRNPFPVKFYLVAVLFILFDIEVVFLYPWAVLFREFQAAGVGLFIFIEMMVFLGILVVGLFYLYGRRAIEW